ncbi:hypothetical protein HanRHA438_Chr02g0061531 [Helianthus annuus]|nr:hypothetical protein HanRHA438_Chr02g0061531 [Helianthus annuus]
MIPVGSPNPHAYPFSCSIYTITVSPNKAPTLIDKKKKLKKVYLYESSFSSFSSCWSAPNDGTLGLTPPVPRATRAKAE